MKLLETFESKKGNKLIFRQNESDIPSLGSVVLMGNRNSSSNREKREIGKIIDVFGPVKTPWVVVNLKKDIETDLTLLNFYWKKEDKKKDKKNKFNKRRGGFSNKNKKFSKKKKN